MGGRGSSSLPLLCSKCVFLKHRICRVETLGSQREARKPQAFLRHLAGCVEEMPIEAGAARQGDGLSTQGQAESEHPEGNVPFFNLWLGNVILGLVFL